MSQIQTRSIASAIGGKYALDPSLIWILFPFTILSVTWLNWVNAGGPFLSWVSVGIFVHAGMIIAATPLYLLFFKDREVNPLFSLATYVFLGLIRGTGVALSARALGLESGPFPIFRPVGGAFVTIAFCAVTVWMIDGRRNYKTLMQELSTTRAALADSESQINEVLQTDRRRLLDLISTAIRGPIEAIQSFALDQETRSSQKVLALINDTIDNRIKPLSRQLAGEIRTWRPISADLEPHKAPGLRTFNFSNPTHPALLGAIALLVAPTMFSRYLPVSHAIALTCACSLAITLTCQFITKTLRVDKEEFPLIPGLIIGSLISGLSYFPAGVLLSLESSFGSAKGAYVTSGAVAITIGGLMIAAARANEEQRSRTERALRESNLQLASAIAQGSGRLWVQQRQIAEILHGQVQSSLIVASARLMSASTTEADVDSLQLLLKPIDDALRALNEPSHLESTDRFFSELKEVWSGLIEIRTHISEEAHTILEAEPSTGMIIMTIIRESVGNAYRSGGADMVDVFLTANDNNLELVMENNGILETPGSGEGLGTQLLRAAATSYSRGPESGVQTLRATVPFTR